MRTYCLAGLITVLMAGGAPAQKSDIEAQKAEMKSLAERIKYQEGKITLGNDLATVNLGDAYRYVDPAGADTILTGIWGNPAARQKHLGMIVPKGFSPFDDASWCVVMNYEGDGYIKDDDADSINYTKLLKEMQNGTKEANKERVKEGYPEVTLVGWATPPRYDKQTHKMYWAKELKFGSENDENTLNYNLRLLGRGGVLILNAVASMKQLPDIEKATPDILAMVDFNPGQRYADYKPGVDKVATYGLAALVAGGIAAKAGLFKVLLAGILAMKKFLIVAVIAAVALVKKLLGGKQQS